MHLDIVNGVANERQERGFVPYGLGAQGNWKNDHTESSVSGYQNFRGHSNSDE
jgi:hypothetical protein